MHNIYVAFPQMRERIRAFERRWLVLVSSVSEQIYFVAGTETKTSHIDEVPSSSGSGHLVLIQEIAGSNPAGITN